ncbi:MAG: DNA polymerase III subunit beta [Desulfuromonas sp.]|nr:MAG: DNA polymerase III subunit beta [Desulfuromonas sp.]
MHFTIEREVFVKALSKVQGIVEKRSTIPILSNVLIQAEDNSIRLIATDLEVGMKTSYPATVKKIGKITVSAKKLYEIVREFPDGEISFIAKENCWIELRCGKALFNIVGLSPDEFPYFPDTDEQKFFQVPADLLKEMVEKTAYAISTDETKYNLNGIYFREMNEDGNTNLRLVATDGHRLALYQADVDVADVPQLQKGVILPRKGVQELRKITEEGEGNIELGFFDNNAVLRRDQTTVVMRLVDGEFPDYERVIPKTRDQEALIDREAILHVLKRVSILANERSRGVKLKVSPNSLELSSSNPELGEAREDLEIDYQGPEITIGFNARYLLDILQNIDDETIEMVFKDQVSPTLISPQDKRYYRTVIMPMRL